ncbi:hypothetical protein AKJ09_04476 [Labilithrix luteola]|uniref:Uncharacterized protein n=1 Tax=Labilithrix luteola TaxID=1391654 RepID=A0A0K1PWB9_9BACT|nr:hypothetical protein AKJ09_04476 [Labilithrix luteola]
MPHRNCYRAPAAIDLVRRGGETMEGSFDKRREGGRVKKRYFRPATPCDRLLASSEINEDTR